PTLCPYTTLFRSVFNMSKEEVKQIAVTGTQLVKKYTAEHPETNWFYEYSPEVFSTTEPEFALEVCHAVMDVWQPTPEKKIVFNLPATIEATTPNMRSEEHTSELQSRENLVCRLLLEKKNR